MTLKRKGGRPPGTKGHRNKGLFKKCGCRRRDWWRCGHPVYMNYRSVRINLNLHAKLPPSTKLSRAEAEVLRANIVEEISEGTFKRESVAAATDKLTLRDVADRYLEDFKSDPNRRSHRAKKLDCAIGAHLAQRFLAQTVYGSQWARNRFGISFWVTSRDSAMRADF